MVRRRVARTLVEDVHAELRADILAGRIEPGTRLKMAQVSGRLGVSLSVLREALNRLVEQALVTLEPQVGFRVVELSPEDLCDLTVARVQIETAALRASVRRGGLEWESAVLAAHHTLAGTPTVVDGELSPTWVDAHAIFHQSLIAACGSRRLLDIACALRESAELYRSWSRPASEASGRDIAAEHRLLCDAALAHDADRATEVLTDHIERTTDLLIRRRPGTPDTGAETA